MTTRRRTVARHEAAHAVLAVRFDLEVVRVAINPPGSAYDGYVTARWPHHADPRVGVALAAGEAADRIFRHPDAGELSSGDRELAAARGFDDAAWRHLVGLARFYLLGELQSQWHAVTDALIERNLSGDEVAAFVVAGVPIDL